MWDKQKVKSEILSYVFIFLGVFGFKSTNIPPYDDKFHRLENEMYELVKSIRFKPASDEF